MISLRIVLQAPEEASEEASVVAGEVDGMTVTVTVTEKESEMTGARHTEDSGVDLGALRIDKEVGAR